MERIILVAEDSPTQAEQLRLLLEREGYRIQLVGNGREGLERVQSSPPDLIVSDIMMPGLDGYAFCREVKSAQRTRRIPFVLLTERNAPSDIIRGLQAGADNFITKPFEDDYLLERVRRIFENLELRQKGHLDVEVTLSAGGQQVVINADKQQMIELLFSTLEELVRVNGKLAESQRVIEEHARNLEDKVRERTERLLQTEKLATMGELLAGVAHELNNPLSVLVGQTVMLRQAVEGGPLAGRAEKITRAADRCARIVKNFLALARQHPPERHHVLLNKVVQEAIELLAYPLRVADIEVTLDLAGDLPVLWADPHQLQQVVVNLVSNAHHAMREMPSPRQLRLSSRLDRARGRVVLEVADTGPGVPRHIQAQIFEPFFTTKPPGQGTGLGLSICQGLVEGHGGSIRVESQPGQGATFLVELPLAAPPIVEPEDRAGSAPPSIRGKAILVVDDEPEIAGTLAEMLAADGHQVDMAANGALALDKLRERAYDLVLSDLRMPVLDGPGLYRELERRDPGLLARIIFVTGDVLSLQAREFLERTAALTLNKPFNEEEMRRVIQQALWRR
jgi:signal transduction histidine kinase